MPKLTEPYTPFLEAWPKEAGPKPTNAEIRQAHDTGMVRAGTKDALAVIMAMRPAGTTQAQIKAVLGAPHRNKIKNLIVAGAAKRISAKRNEHGHTVYKLEVKKRPRKDASQEASHA